MNKLILLALGLLVSLNLATAQTNFASFYLPNRAMEFINTSVSPDGDICLVTQTQGELTLYHMDENGQLKNKAVNPLAQGVTPSIIGSLALADKFVFFEPASPLSVDRIRPFYLDRQTGKLLFAAEHQLPLEPRSQFLSAFTRNNALYLLYYGKKTDSIQVFMFTSETAYTVKTFKLNTFYMQERLLKPTGPVYVNAELENDFSLGQHPKKIYLENNKLYFLVDSFIGPGNGKKKLTTDILTLDLDTEQSNFAVLPYIEDTNHENISSFLYKNTIYRYVMTGKDRVMLEMYNPETTALKKSYTYTGNDKITLQATHISKTDKMPDTTQTETASSMIRKMHTGVVSVVANNAAPNVIELQLGTYDEKTSIGASAFLPTGTSLLPAMGPAAIPIIAALVLIKSTAPDAPVQEKNAVYRAYLDAETFDVVQPVKTVSVAEMVRAQTIYLMSSKTSIGAVTVYPHKGNVHYAYVDKKARELKIVSLKRDDYLNQATSSNQH